MAKALATVGVLSIGDMGLGVAKLLLAHDFKVLTSVAGRSEYTRRRAETAKVETVEDDKAFVERSDYIISIVPPRDAVSTAQRVHAALKARPTRLLYLDLNATSPSTARHLASIFQNSSCDFVDGAIIGGPPSPRVQAGTSTAEVTNVTAFQEDSHAWNRPSIPLSGPVKLQTGPSGTELASLLNTRHISNEIGSASGLKCCFATLTKGFTALAIQSFTTASELGVLGELKGELGRSVPHLLGTAEKGVCAMPPKAYRWVREMEEIGVCHAEDGGFTGGLNLFERVAGAYREVELNEVLGQERTGERKRGRTVEDVGELMAEGLKKKAKKDA